MDSELDERVLLRAATSKDVTMARMVLERANFVVHSCTDLEEVVRELERGVGVLVLAEETLSAGTDALKAGLATQGEWSEVPIIVLARQGASSPAIAQIMDHIPNVTVIERPMRIAAFVSAIRTALLARRRQYELRGLLTGLREADRRKTEFLAMLAHELRNPLAPMSNAVTLLTLKAPTPDDIAKYCQLMRRQIDHMVRLVDDLLEVSRITRGKIELRMETVVLDAIIRDAVEQSRPLFERVGHTLTVDLEGNDALVVRGDSLRLTQIFANLLNNAAKYTAPGGRVSVSARSGAGHVQVLIADNGAGIEPQMLESIFDMFVQANDTSKAAQGGLGIGLTLVRALVELHGGQVSASSNGLGRGASFCVSLPLSSDLVNLHPQPTAHKETDVPLQGKVILVVDDNVDAADALGELLTSLGASVLVAHDGYEALQVARTSDFNAAVLDLGMPGLDGFELARRLKAQAPEPGRTYIALTGWNEQTHRERIAQAGFDHHLLKPVDLPKLLKALQGK